jgi:hypothetical protein
MSVPKYEPSYVQHQQVNSIKYVLIMTVFASIFLSLFQAILLTDCSEHTLSPFLSFFLPVLISLIEPLPSTFVSCNAPCVFAPFMRGAGLVFR